MNENETQQEHGLGKSTANDACSSYLLPLTMNNSPHQGTDTNTSRPMLSPIRTAQPPQPPPPPSSAMGPVTNSTRLPFFADTHLWSSSPRQSAHQAVSSSSASLSGLAHNSYETGSYASLQQQPELVVASNVHNFSSTGPPRYLESDASMVPRFENSLSPVDNASAQQMQTAFGHSSTSASVSPMTVTNKTTTTTTTAKSTRVSGSSSTPGASRAPRAGGVGKPAISISTKNAAGSGAAGRSGSAAASTGSGGGRNAQPKSSRKQFSACGACQLRQLSVCFLSPFSLCSSSSSRRPPAPQESAYFAAAGGL